MTAEETVDTACIELLEMGTDPKGFASAQSLVGFLQAFYGPAEQFSEQELTPHCEAWLKLSS